MAKPGETADGTKDQTPPVKEGAEAQNVPASGSEVVQPAKTEKTSAQKKADADLSGLEQKSNEHVVTKAAEKGGIEDRSEEDEDKASARGTDPDVDADDKDEKKEKDGVKDEDKEDESTGFGAVVAYFNKFSKENPDASMTSALFATAVFALKGWFSKDSKKAEAGVDSDEDKDEDADEGKGTDTLSDEERSSKAYSESLKTLLAEFGLAEGSDPKRNFFNVAERLAKEVEEKYGVPRQVTLAQALLESGHGQSGLTQNACNCFGMKLGSNNSAEYVSMETTEHRDGTDVREYAKFRSYPSLRDSFMDYGKMLSTSERYKAAFDHKDDPKRFLTEVIKGGYATDPNYVQKAEAVLKPYGGSLQETEPTSSEPIA